MANKSTAKKATEKATKNVDEKKEVEESKNTIELIKEIIQDGGEVVFRSKFDTHIVDSPLGRIEFKQGICRVKNLKVAELLLGQNFISLGK